VAMPRATLNRPRIAHGFHKRRRSHRTDRGYLTERREKSPA